MIVYIFALALICVYGMKIYGLKTFNSQYMSKDNTNSIKGIFVFLIFASHFTQYYTLTTSFDKPYYIFKLYFLQLVVTMFFFYSGYGLFESFSKKGMPYIKSIPAKRFFKTLIHLDIAIIIFVILDFILGTKITILQTLLSLIGWQSVGNSNWFMFVILAEYLFVFISFFACRGKKIPSLITLTVLSIVFIIVVKQFKSNYWINTVMCLPAGMWFSLLKSKIEKFSMKNDILYTISLVLCFAVFIISGQFKNYLTVYEIWAISFSMLIVFVSMKVSIGNKCLDWLGKHVFSIYMLQRIPMIVFSRFDVISTKRDIYFILSLICTLIISGLFDKFTGLLDNKLFKKIA